MYETKPYFYGTGRRKKSVARVRIYPGTGAITINGEKITDVNAEIDPSASFNGRYMVVRRGKRKYTLAHVEDGE